MSPEPRPSAKAIAAADEALAKALPAWTGMLARYADFRGVEAMKGTDLHPLELPTDMAATMNQLPKEALLSLLTVALWHETGVVLAAMPLKEKQ
jgi:hypothetical protein